MTLIFLAGYEVHKIGKSVKYTSCIEFMQYNDFIQFEEVSKKENSEYLKFIDRRGLKNQNRSLSIFSLKFYTYFSV